MHTHRDQLAALPKGADELLGDGVLLRGVWVSGVWVNSMWVSRTCQPRNNLLELMLLAKCGLASRFALWRGAASKHVA